MAEHAQIVVKGIVQGVGFRPYVFNLAGSLDLKGYVTNTSDGVLIELEGKRIPEFIQRLSTDAPPLSQITDISIVHLPFQDYPDFTIRRSTDEAGDRPFTLVSADVSVCDDCLRELLDPTDRRYCYPFINCTNCGPRYSITKSVPYDRKNTTMAGFTMCPECHREYLDHRDRRFHAQPNACATCGPQVEFRVRSLEFSVKQTEALRAAIQLLKDGGIIAIKGIGGFHIACDAMNDGVVRKLREKKRKSNKPFAVMSLSLDDVNKFCEVSREEMDLLSSNRRPIVLLQKKQDCPMPEAVSPNNKYVGFMLPYTSLHHLLFTYPDTSNSAGDQSNFKALVMTSGNLSEEPIVRDNNEAIEKLSNMVDAFLFHNRDIFMRVDDSVVRVRNAECGMRSDDNSELLTPNSELQFLRRSRGYAPDPILLHDEGPEVLGCGADLKNTFTLTKGKFAIVSQHIGDMENYETMRFFEECLANLKAVYRSEPVAIVHDLHPGYLSTRWAIEQVRSAECGVRSLENSKSAIRNPQSAINRYAIQHHYAHIGSVMAEHGLRSKVIGVAFDGTGYGTDGNLWGGEFLMADIDGFERVGQFKYVPLPGGEAAIREPWKTAVSFIMNAAGEKARDHLENTGFIWNYGGETIEKIMIVARSREFSPLASGAGRLFDAVSAMLGVCDRNTFEGEAAMALEALVQEGIDDEYRVEFKKENGYTVVDFSPMILAIISDLDGKTSREIISTKFHNTIASVVRTMVKGLYEQYKLSDVVLSGGTFQNRYLLNRVIRALSLDGMNVFTNRNIPCNDACISLGQAYLVRERLKKQWVATFSCLPLQGGG